MLDFKFIIIILAVVLIAGCVEQTKTINNSIKDETTKEEIKIIEQASLCKGSARCIEGIVTRITDGDTLEVDNVSIRLALIDAPEYNEPGWNNSTEFALSICPVGSIAVVDEDDNQTGGSYGRTVGVVYCNGINLNEELVKNGFATIDERFCEVSEFADEEWTGC